MLTYAIPRKKWVFKKKCAAYKAGKGGTFPWPSRKRGHDFLQVAAENLTIRTVGYA